MIDIVIRSVLGPLGSKVLDFYMQNSMMINGLILLYFLLFVLSRRSYHQTLVRIMLQVEKSGMLPKDQSDKTRIQNEINKIKICWEEVVGESPFPFISSSSGLFIYPKNIYMIKKIFSSERLTEIITKNSGST